MKTKRQYKKKTLDNKTNIQLDWFELLDLKYVLREFLRNEFLTGKEMKRLYNDKNYLDILLISNKRIFKIYKTIINKAKQYN